MPNKPSALKTCVVPVLIKGQLWKYGERCIRIEHVGKMLVEHRGVSLETRHNVSTKRMGSIRELQMFITANNAVLLAN